MEGAQQMEKKEGGAESRDREKKEQDQPNLDKK